MGGGGYLLNLAFPGSDNWVLPNDDKTINFGSFGYFSHSLAAIFVLPRALTTAYRDHYRWASGLCNVRLSCVSNVQYA